MKTSFLAVPFLLAALSSGAFTVENVSATPRLPWQSLIDIDFEICGAVAGTVFAIDASATSADGTRTFCAHTFRSEPLGSTGANRITWDFGADYPDVDPLSVSVTVTATQVRDTLEMYCVIDLSSGPDSERYPVRYSLTGPGHVRGAFGEKCQTTEMWLKRIQPGSYRYLKATSDNGVYEVRITKRLYAGLFECTQQQWFQVTGKWPAKFSNETWRACRPVESIFHDQILGHHNWPDKQTVTDDSFVGRVRRRTGLTTFNLPTEGQWEYFMRAGSKGSDIRPNNSYSYNDIARYWRDSGDNVSDYSIGPEHGTAVVGSFLPNNWGLYDCSGNVMELVLDSFVSSANLKTLYADELADPGYVTDPIGPPNSTSAPIHPTTVWRHVARGGSYDNSSGNCSTYARAEVAESAPKMGARFVVVCE